MRPLVRRCAIVVALLVAGLFSGWVTSAGADIPPLPTVPTLPQVPTVPAVPLPPAPRPPQVPPVSVPRVPPVAPPVSRPSLPLGGGGSGTSSSSGSGSGASPRGSTRHAGSGPKRVYALHFSRNWIARSGPKHGRYTVLVFTLGKPGVVQFVVTEISPDCRRVGRFRVLGRAGVNRVRFRGRVGGRVLGPGTYRIAARTLPRGRVLMDTELVIVTSPESDVFAADACGSGTAGQSTSSNGSGTPSTPGAGATPATQGNAEKKTQSPRAHGVLGARFTKKALVDAVTGIPLWLYVLLGFAIALLALAALPLRAAPTRQGATALARRRGLIALAGAAALVAVTVSYALR